MATDGSCIHRFRPRCPVASGSEPVVEPPVSSIRWEMLREGIEDYEYLWLLGDLISKKRSSLTAEQLKTYNSRCWRYPGLSPAT